jgi:methylated-DNA-[protein]-cysteine S-methyltransferase
MKSMTANEYETARRRFVLRAEAEGLIDVAVEQHDTPLGPITLAATSQGVVRLGLPNEHTDAVLEDLACRISPRVLNASRTTLTAARWQIAEYFAGVRTAFDVPIDWRLAVGFRRDVLRAARCIQYGATASYREVAADAGKPRAVRAAATALATNPLPILVPCHRVIRTNGRPGGYRGDPNAKTFLLELERGR